MSQRTFISYYNKQLAAFRRHFRRARKKGAMEDIHRLRVSVKKLRTLWTLAEMASAGKWNAKPCAQLCKPMYQVAGKLRETQVNLNLIEPVPGEFLEPFSDYLKKSQKRLTRQLHRSMQAFDRKQFDAINRQLRRRMRDLPDETCFREAVACALKKSAKVKALTGRLPGPRQLHKIRIHQKAVQEILTILKKVRPDLPIEPLLEPIRALNSSIGKWHDTWVLLDSLKHFGEKGGVKSGRQPMKELMERLEQQLAVEHGEACRLLHAEAIGQQLRLLSALAGE